MTWDRLKAANGWQSDALAMLAEAGAGLLVEVRPLPGRFPPREIRPRRPPAA